MVICERGDDSQSQDLIKVQKNYLSQKVSKIPIEGAKELISEFMKTQVISNLSQMFKDDSEELARLEQQQTDEQDEGLLGQLDEYEEKINNLNFHIKEKNEEIERLRDQVEDAKMETRGKDQELQILYNENEKLKDQVTQSALIPSSHS